MPDKQPRSILINNEKKNNNSKVSQIIIIAIGLLLAGMDGDYMSHNHIELGLNLYSLGFVLAGGLAGIGIKNLLPRK